MNATFSIKLRGWCLWHLSDEAGVLVVQVGPFIVEIERTTR